MAVETYLGIGTNLGDRKANILYALKMLDAALGVQSTALSPLFESEPWGFSSPDRFLNCAVRYDTDMGPHEILEICKDIEARMGRNVAAPEFDGNGRRIYRSRIIDIDILLYGQGRISLPDLAIPHPLMRERDFVMVPLSAIVSDDTRLSFPEIFTEDGRKALLGRRL